MYEEGGRALEFAEDVHLIEHRILAPFKILDINLIQGRLADLYVLL